MKTRISRTIVFLIICVFTLLITWCGYNPRNETLVAVTQLGEVLEIYNFNDSTHQVITIYATDVNGDQPLIYFSLQAPIIIG